MKKAKDCLACCGTGVLRAAVKYTEEGCKFIDAVVCLGHFNQEAAEKSLLAMHNATGLNVDVSSAEKPVEKNDYYT